MLKCDGKGVKRVVNNHGRGFTDMHSFRLSCSDSSWGQHCDCHRSRAVWVKIGRQEHSMEPVPLGSHQSHEQYFESSRDWSDWVPNIKTFLLISQYSCIIHCSFLLYILSNQYLEFLNISFHLRNVTEIIFIFIWNLTSEQ